MKRRRQLLETVFIACGRIAIGFSVLCLVLITMAIVWQAQASLRSAYWLSDHDAVTVEPPPEGLLSVYALSQSQQYAAHTTAYLLTDTAARSLRDTARLQQLPLPQQQWLQQQRQAGLIVWRFNWQLFTQGNSRHPEWVGVWASLKGSLLALGLALILAVPLGVAAAVYLEEFAAHNRLTTTIEVTVNNLAAIPSIVYGLLGLALLINVLQVPRAVPLVGGLVLAMMLLPMVIISSRAAIQAVPSDIRYAAIGVGASTQQVVLHHVLPQAASRIITGIMLAAGNLLGESAPLLTLGMVAFFADVPQHITDPATVLPVQIYMWSVSADPAYMEAAAMAILLLLCLLSLLNLTATLIRRRLDSHLKP